MLLFDDKAIRPGRVLITHVGWILRKLGVVHACEELVLLSIVWVAAVVADRCVLFTFHKHDKALRFVALSILISTTFLCMFFSVEFHTIRIDPSP